MRTRQIASGLVQYAIVAAGQAVIAYGIQQGLQRVAFVTDERRKRKTKVGFIK